MDFCGWYLFAMDGLKGGKEGCLGEEISDMGRDLLCGMEIVNVDVRGESV